MVHRSQQLLRQSNSLHIWNPKVHTHVYNSPQPDPVLIQINPVHALLLVLYGLESWKVTNQITNRSQVFLIDVSEEY
jgi:hypothetical protein